MCFRAQSYGANFGLMEPTPYTPLQSPVIRCNTYVFRHFAKTRKTQFLQQLGVTFRRAKRNVLAAIYQCRQMFDQRIIVRADAFQSSTNLHHKWKCRAEYITNELFIIPK